MTTAAAVVVIASPLRPSEIDEIRSIDRAVEVRHRPSLYPTSWDIVNPGWGGGAPPWGPAEWAVWRDDLRDADVLFDLEWVPDLGYLRRDTPALRWIQATIAGVAGEVERLGPVDEVVVTTASGIQAVPIAEWVLSSLLALVRDTRRSTTDQMERRWEPRPTPLLHGRTAIVFGFGHVGHTIGRYLRAVGVRVVAVTRTSPPAVPADADEALDARTWTDALPRADLLVLAAPLTAQTFGVVGERELQRLPDHALVVNVGRGALLDEAALERALADHSVAGAALDVFVREPLPSDSPLWRMPNVILSPHAAGFTKDESRRIVELFCVNLERYLAGTELVNVYRPALGY